MSYDNAEPKILKTLNSNGQVLDSSGEVIADTSDYWVKTYNQAEPKPDKILNADGTITDSAGNLIQDTTPFNVKKYNQAEPIPAKYLHSDGTIDENSSSGGADLDNNVSKTIDVSTYTEPVVINPTSGKDGMKKATVTLTNIPRDINNINQEVSVIKCIDTRVSSLPQLLLAVNAQGDILDLGHIESANRILVLSSGNGNYRDCYRIDEISVWFDDVERYNTELIYFNNRTFELNETTLTISGEDENDIVYVDCEDFTVSLALTSIIGTSS